MHEALPIIARQFPGRLRPQCYALQAEEGAEQAPVRRRLWGRQDSLWNAQGAKDPAKRPLSPLGHLALPQAKRHCPEPEPGKS